MQSRTGSVNEQFKKYMEAEISVMLSDIGMSDRQDSRRFTLKALRWIKRNAADFRVKWDNDNNAVVGETHKNGKEAQ
jgi:hypothetical protein